MNFAIILSPIVFSFQTLDGLILTTVALISLLSTKYYWHHLCCLTPTTTNSLKENTICSCLSTTHQYPTPSSTRTTTRMTTTKSAPRYCRKGLPICWIDRRPYHYFNNDQYICYYHPPIPNPIFDNDVVDNNDMDNDDKIGTL